jgi:hypothetical protein
LPNHFAGAQLISLHPVLLDIARAMPSKRNYGKASINLRGKMKSNVTRMMSIDKAAKITALNHTLPMSA